MVKKLYKHEIMALGRLMLPVLCAVLGVGVFTRIIQFFESDTSAYRIVEVSSFVVLGIAIVASMILAMIFGIVRYYKNLFSCEGYLSFTLPVTPAQHLWVKSTIAVMFSIATFLAAVLALVIALSGEPIVEITKAGVYLWKLVIQELSATQLILYFVELLVLLLVSVFCQYYLYYTCITIGQTAKKNRIMLAVVVYFIYTFIVQTITTIGMVMFSVFAQYLPLEEIEAFMTKHPYASGHIILIGSIVLTVILIMVYYFICHKIIRKKLNLE